MMLCDFCVRIFAVGSSLRASESDEEEVVFNREVDSLVERYGRERILQRLLNSRGVLLQHNWCMQLRMYTHICSC